MDWRGGKNTTLKCVILSIMNSMLPDNINFSQADCSVPGRRKPALLYLIYVTHMLEKEPMVQKTQQHSSSFAMDITVAELPLYKGTNSTGSFF